MVFNSYLAVVLNSADFDYLLSKGNNNAPINRSSLLLKFDPLLGVAVPVNQPSTHEGGGSIQSAKEQQQQQQLPLPHPLQPLHIPSTLGVKNLKSNVPQLSPTLEENDHDDMRNQLLEIKDSEQQTSYTDGQREKSSPPIPSSQTTTTTALNCTINQSTPGDNHQLDSSNTTFATPEQQQHPIKEALTFCKKELRQQSLVKNARSNREGIELSLGF